MSNLNLKTITFPELDNTYEIAVQPDSNCDNLTAGTALAVLSDSYTEDAVPYKFRRTPYKSRRLMDEIVGGTVAWNQLLQNGNFADTSVWNQANATLTISDNTAHFVRTDRTAAGRIMASKNTIQPYEANHKYLITANIKCNALTSDRVSLRYLAIDIVSITPSTYTAGTWATLATVFSSQNDGVSTYLQVYDYRKSDEGDGKNDVYVKNAMIIDLTAMFGTTIADYIYTLEQSTAGAGVALFRSMFPDAYYAYNAGELISISGLSARKAVGFNQWDEVWEIGGYNASGNKSTATDRIRSANRIRVFPNTAYYAQFPSTSGVAMNFIAEYGEDGAYLRAISRPSSGILNIPSDCYYIAFSMNPAYGLTYNHDICINISDPAKNGTYEPYEEHTYPLDSTLTLRGIPKLDSNNKLYFDGDTYASDGTVTRRYGIVDLGTLTWYAIEKYFGADVAGIKRASTWNSVGNLLCAPYAITTGNAINGATIDKAVAVLPNADRIWIRDTAYTDAASFKTAMNGVYLVYELATATTEQADPYINPQICDPDGTEEYVTTGIVPVGHETKYYKDIVSAIEGIPDLPTTAGNYVLKVTVSGGVPTYSWVTA